MIFHYIFDTTAAMRKQLFTHFGFGCMNLSLFNIIEGHIFFLLEPTGIVSFFIEPSASGSAHLDWQRPRCW